MHDDSTMPPPRDPPTGQMSSAAPGTLQRLMDESRLSPVFQPVVDLRTASIYGHEALIRGPHDGPLHMPAELLELAARASLQVEFELHCVDLALRRWASLGQAGRLFVNMSPDVLLRAADDGLPHSLRSLLSASRVSPHLVVIELTEQGSASDWPALRQAVKAVRSLGVLLALDDFGEAHSGLRRWAELRPDFVKIDKFFTRSISTAHENVEVVRAIQQIGSAMGTQLIAEGITQADDLRLLRDLDIHYGQGHFLGRPAEAPLSRIAQAVTLVLRDNDIAIMPNPGQAHAVLRGLPIVQAPGVEMKATNEDVSKIFQDRVDLHALAMVQEGRPVALINRQEFMNRYAQLYFREVHGRKPAASYAHQTPLTIELDADVQELMGVLMSEDQRYLRDGFIFTEGGNYVGLGTGDQLVRAVTETRIEAARYANPLTSLPGNIPINMHIERLLIGGADFAACYADLNNFKAFNDHYGYWRGDEMIRAAARLLGRHSDPKRDFVGHIGGDDFIVLFQSADWERRCARIVEEFGKQAFKFYSDADREAGGIEAEDRHGINRFFSICSLSIGAVRIHAGTMDCAEDVANEASLAKHEAKMSPSGFAIRTIAVLD
ncbi:MAG: GGDEF domain-containing protein [Variovorax sp.]